MTEGDPVAVLSAELKTHQHGCAKETKLNRLETAKMRAAVGELEKKVTTLSTTVDSVNTKIGNFEHAVAGVQKTFWRGLQFISGVIFASAVTVIAADLNTQHAAEAQAKIAAQTVAETAKAVSTNNKNEIIRAVNAKK
jgi:hypothetical protein